MRPPTMIWAIGARPSRTQSANASAKSHRTSDAGSTGMRAPLASMIALSFNGAAMPHGSGPNTGETGSATRRPLVIACVQAASGERAACCEFVSVIEAGVKWAGRGGGVGTLTLGSSALRSRRSSGATYREFAGPSRANTMNTAAQTRRRVGIGNKMGADNSPASNRFNGSNSDLSGSSGTGGRCGKQ